VPGCEQALLVEYAFGGVLGDYLRSVADRWLKVAPASNPAMLEMFRDRDRQPYRQLEPWAGEFAGKYLTAATEVLRVTGDPELRAVLGRFVGELLTLQDQDGYLGPWPREHRLANSAPNASGPGRSWDAWGHYHVMLGLMLWSETADDPRALAAARRIADLLCARFLGDRAPRLVDTGSTEMNLAPAHALAMLYRRTAQERYLRMAEQIIAEFSATDGAGEPLAGNYLNGPLAGREFHQLPKPRWESLHPIMALAEVQALTGRADCRAAFERIWRSIVRNDRHNNGGFSSGEKATGNPYDPAPIESCCTIAWMALSVEMLRLTGDPAVADELELSLFNSVLGMHSRAGRWSTYNTPMDGLRIASTQAIGFQARAGSPELNCCSANAARGLGLLWAWALLPDGGGLALNCYAPMTLTVPLAGANSVVLTQETSYPYDARVLLTVAAQPAAEFVLKLRIPRWSRSTRVTLNGRPVEDVRPGSYLPIARAWSTGDRLEIIFDFSPHVWTGARQCAGKTSLYRGPILMTYDRRYNEMDPGDLPALSAQDLAGRRVAWEHWLPPRLLMELSAVDGRKVRLCDFGSAGEGGSPYRSWLEIEPGGPRPAEYFAPQALPWPGC